jgi:hypothetical protein
MITLKPYEVDELHNGLAQLYINLRAADEEAAEELQDTYNNCLSILGIEND